MAKFSIYTDRFNALVALEALRGDMTVQEIAAKPQLQPNQAIASKHQAIDGMADMLSGGKQDGLSEAEIKNCMPKAGGWRSRATLR